MTAQPSLWCWTDALPVGTRLRSRYTGNRGHVVAVEPGSHVVVRWGAMGEREPYEVRHSSDAGLEVLT